MKAEDFQVLLLEGPARERGRAHGEALRGLIHEMVGEWKENIYQDLRMDPDLFLAELLSETDFIPAIQRWTPSLLEEVEGIAEGAAMDFDTIFARQLTDEEPWFRIEKRLGKTWGVTEHCSAIGCNRQGDTAAINAQNMDTPSYYDGYQVLLHIKYPDSPLEVLMFTIAGKINLAGMSNAPVSICCNTVLQLSYNKCGLPEDFVVRGALEQASLADAVDFMYRIPHASGQNYLIGGPDRVLSLECSANKVAEFQVAPNSDRVWHTNHPLINDDCGIHEQRLEFMPEEERADWLDFTGERSNTHARFHYLNRELCPANGALSVTNIREHLSSREAPVCQHTDHKITLGCLIMEMGEPPVLHLSPGPPCYTPFTTYQF